jgi:hypothetical protein
LKRIPVILCLVLGFAVARPAFAAAPAPVITRATLKKLAPHPRLILTEKRLAEIKRAAKTDERLAWKIQVLTKDADALLTMTPSVRVLIGPRLLAVSRETVRRVYTLGLLYRLSGDSRYAERAKLELLTVAAFPDWNPSHFLDVAEMSHAVAVGYDWLYGYLKPAERKILREALVEKGMKPILPLYATDEWQVSDNTNWNQVCNGGLGIACLSLGDEEPELAQKIMNHGFRLLPNALKSYGTDGGWAEGPSYWNYATRYTAYYINALQTALGKDFGLSNYEGLKKAGNFYMHAVGPGRRSFNYADAKEHLDPSHAMAYLAMRFKRPIYNLVNDRGFTEKNVDPFTVMWHQGVPQDLNLDKEPLDAYFKSVEVAFFRSAWASDTALYLGFKGGDNTSNHGHLDLGSFILDADGVRWAVDLGGDEYNLPGYFDKGAQGQRWQYYRMGSHSHNTLVIDGQDQLVEAQAPISSFSSKPDLAFAVADLTKAYAATALSTRRGLALIGRQQVLVQDELKLKAGSHTVRWCLVTRADLKLEGDRALLSQEGRQLEAKILAPQGAVFTEVSTRPKLKTEDQNGGTRMLAVNLAGVTETTVAVLLSPLGSSPTATVLPTLKPLDRW